MRNWKHAARTAAGLSAAFIAGLGATVAGAEESYPSISGSVVVEMQNDLVTSADDSTTEVNNLTATVEPEIEVRVTENIGGVLALTLEQITGPGPDADNYLENHGGFIEQLYGFYEGEGFSVKAGKFNPNFSIGYDAAPGVYGTDLLEEDVELTEMIGLGGAIGFDGGETGEHEVSASLFFRDTTALSDSVPSRRGGTQKADGGVANTETLNNFVIALDSENVGGVDGLRTHVGLQHLSNGRLPTETEDQFGLSIGAEAAFDVGPVTLTPLLEYNFFDGFGAADQKNHYITDGVTAEYAGANLALSHTWRGQRPLGAQNLDDHQFQVSAGYAFDFGLSADVGYKWFNGEGQTDSETFGVLVGYELEF